MYCSLLDFVSVAGLTERAMNGKRNGIVAGFKVRYGIVTGRVKYHNVP